MPATGVSLSMTFDEGVYDLSLPFFEALFPPTLFFYFFFLAGIFEEIFLHDDFFYLLLLFFSH